MTSFSVYVYPDIPAKPNISSDNSLPFEGYTLTLTCSTPDPAVSHFRFYRDSSLVQYGPSDVYVISTNTFYVNDGSYTCSVYSNSFQTWSHSDSLQIDCEYVWFVYFNQHIAARG